MTGVPTPRGDTTTGGAEVLSYVASTVGRLEESVERGFRELREQIAEFPRTYVSQREFDRTRDGFTFDIAELRRLREQDDADRRTARRQLLALAVGTGMSAVGVATTLVLHFT